MNKLVLYFKGILIGLANVVAGLSGGTVAVILNVYEDLIDFFSNLVTHLISALKKHYRLLIGIVIGLVLGAVALNKLYKIAPLPVTGFFAGLVFISLFPLAKTLSFKEGPKWNTIHTILMLLSCAALVALAFGTKGSQEALSLNAKSIFILLGLGVIVAVAMILPGVSGAMILLVLGYYEDVTGMVTKLFKFSSEGYGQNFVMLLVFAIGALIGLVLGSKLVKLLLKACKNSMNFVIYGLIVGSIVGMFVQGINANTTLIGTENLGSSKDILMHVLAVVFFVIGAGLAVLFEYLNCKKNKSLTNDNKENNMKELTMDDFLAKAEEVWPEFKETLAGLVKCESVLDEYKENSDAPFGQGNKEALNFMLNLGKKDGFKTLNCDNYAGHIQFGDAKECLGLLSHLDVVPVTGQKWDSDPFTVVERNGKLYGRGVNDDKGPTLASYFAIKILKDYGFKPNKNIKLIMGCDEETGSRCLAHYFSKNPMPELGFSPDACFPCINGEKAHAHIDVIGKTDSKCPIISFYCGERYNIVPEEAHMTLDRDLSKEYLEFLKENNYKGEYKDSKYYAYGVAAHAMTPEKGFNAAFILFEFVNKYVPCNISQFMAKYITFDPFGKKLGIDREYPEMGTLSENVGVVRISDHHIKVGFDLRVPADEMEELIRQAFFNATKEFEGLSFDMPAITPVHYVPSDSFLVQDLVKSYQEATGDYEHKAYCIGGGTYAKFMDKAVAFGPQFVGREDVDHQANEYIYESDYKKIIAIYAKSIYDLTK